MTNMMNSVRDDLSMVVYRSWNMSGFCVSAERMDGNMVMKMDCDEKDYRSVFLSRETFDTESLLAFLKDSEGEALFEMKGYVLGEDYLICTDLTAKTPKHIGA